MATNTYKGRHCEIAHRVVMEEIKTVEGFVLNTYIKEKSFTVLIKEEGTLSYLEIPCPDLQTLQRLFKAIERCETPRFTIKANDIPSRKE